MNDDKPNDPMYALFDKLRNGIAQSEKHKRRLAFVAAVGWLLFAIQVARSEPNLNPLLDAMCMIESGNRDLPLRWDVNGVAIGPLQIHAAYAADAGRSWRRCRERAYARETALRYFRRYEPLAVNRGDYRALARLHNAGPGWRRAGNEGYWLKVKREIH
jgi:hypothetical protein